MVLLNGSIHVSIRLRSPGLFALHTCKSTYPAPTTIKLTLPPPFPGANVNQTAETNRTLWPLTGGSVTLDLHHPWTYVFINLGLGTDYPSPSISLTPEFLNTTGNGTLCLPVVPIPASANVTDGQNATIQIVTLGETGSALYNVSSPLIPLSSPGVEDYAQDKRPMLRIYMSSAPTSPSAARPHLSRATSARTTTLPLPPLSSKSTAPLHPRPNLARTLPRPRPLLPSQEESPIRCLSQEPLLVLELS